MRLVAATVAYARVHIGVYYPHDVIVRVVDGREHCGHRRFAVNRRRGS